MHFSFIVSDKGLYVEGKMKSNLTEIVAFLEKEFPQSLEKCRIESVTERAATVVDLHLLLRANCHWITEIP